MANEWIPMFAQGSVLGIPFICADATGIEMGTALKLTDPFTASAASAANDIVAGVALAEKIANSGVTTVSTARGGIWKVVASGAISAGNAIVLSGNNTVWAAAVNNENIVGIAFETAADTDTLLIELKPVVMNLA